MLKQSISGDVSQMEKGNPGYMVYMTGERMGIVQDKIKALNLCGDRYGGFSYGE